MPPPWLPEVIARAASGFSAWICLVALIVSVSETRAVDASRWLGPAQRFLKVVRVIPHSALGVGKVRSVQWIGDEGWLLVDSRERVQVVDALTGAVRWRLPRPEDREAGPCWAGGRILLVTGGGRLTAYDPTTNQAAWSRVWGEGIAAIQAHAGQLYVWGSNHQLFCVEPVSGFTRWALVAPALRFDFMAADARTCLVPLETGELRALDVATGNLLWSHQLPQPLTAPLAIAPGQFLALTEGEILLALDAATGEVRWRHQPARDSPIPKPLQLREDSLQVAGEEVILHGTHFLYNLRILDQQTGHHRHAETLAGHFAEHPFSAGRCLFIPVGSAGLKLVVYDRSRGYIVHQAKLPAELEFVGQWKDQVLARARDALLVIQPDPEAAAQIQELRLASNGFKTVYFLILLLALLGAPAIWVFTGEPRNPPTHQTNLLIAASWITLAMLSLVAGYAGFLILITEVIARSPGVTWILGALLLMVPLAAVQTLFHMYWRPLRAYRQAPVSPTIAEPNDIPISSVVGQLRHDMGINPSTPLVHALRPGEAPCAVGVSRTRAAILLPPNLGEMALDACHGDSTRATQLIRLVLAHEMAHIRNGDVAMLPLRAVITGPLPVFLAIIWLIYLLIRRPGLDTGLQIGGGPAIAFSLLAILGLILLLRLVTVERERLADATASLFMDPDVLGFLTAPPSGTPAGKSPLARLLFQMRAFSSLSHSFLGLPVPRVYPSLSWVQWFSRRMTPASFFQQSAWRSFLLTTKQALFAAHPAGNLASAVIAGITAGFVFSGLAIVLFYAQLHTAIATGAVAGKTLEEQFFWMMNHWPPRPDEALLLLFYFQFAPVAAAILATSLLLLPIRDLPTAFTELRSSGLRQLGVRLLLMMVVFGISSFLIQSLARPPVTIWSVARLSASGACGWIIILTMLFGMGLTFRRPEMLCAVRAMIPMVVPILLAGILVLVMAAILLDGLSLMGRLLWAFVSLMIGAWLIVIQPFRWLSYGSYTSEESLLICVTWGRLSVRSRWHQCESRSARFPGYGDGFRMAKHYLLIWGLILGAGYLPLRNLDRRFFADYPDRLARFQALTATAVDRIQEDNVAFRRQFFPPLFVHSQVGPDRMFASTFVSFSMMVGAEALLLIRQTVRALRGLERRRKLLLQLAALAEAHPILHLSPILRKMASPGRAALARLTSSKRPYFPESNRFPLMSATCRVVEYALAARLKAPQIPAMIQWVGQCENLTGGFGPIPGQPSTPLYTARGLRLFHHLHASTRVPIATHAAWLRRALGRCLSRKYPLPDPLWLEQVHWIGRALEPIQAVCPLADRLRKRVAQEAVLRWRQTQRTVSQTRQLLEILTCMDGQHPALWKHLRQDWWPPHSSSLRFLKPDSALDAIVERLRILQILYPDDYALRPEAQQAKDNIEKVFVRRLA
ncbi:MAG TPA: PQQ-binding-like beta-propeller repeat protein [Candidatus Paceibacterota bacterium]|nr:PQQ-binding-like beta-propeller repeat protein [Verrucomicrobiota bacterium]HRZ93612.1 PQQ-binding-like beta-propeller repeat protein [Candidatus Paceibacterota bacterium]